MKNIRTETFRIEDLISLGTPPPDVTPLVIGDWCTMNSGSQSMLVVDADDETVVVSRLSDGRPEEHSFPRACVRRTVRGVGKCLQCDSATVEPAYYCQAHEDSKA